MGRIVTHTRIENCAEAGASIFCDALVDTSAAYVVLPTACKPRLGKLEKLGDLALEPGDQSQMSGEIYGPVRVQLDGFRPIYTEVLFIEMQPEQGNFEPLLGYIPLEQSQAAVDMVGHRLIPVKKVDLKRIHGNHLSTLP